MFESVMVPVPAAEVDAEIARLQADPGCAFPEGYAQQWEARLAAGEEPPEEDDENWASQWQAQTWDDAPASWDESYRLADAYTGVPLHALSAGADLAGAIGRVVGDLVPGDLEDLADHDLVDLAAAAQRVAGWATAVQMTVLTTHVEQQRPHLRNRTPDREDVAASVTAQEAALACGISRYAAETLINTGSGLATLPTLHRMLLAGELETAKARLVVDKTMPLSPEATAAVEAAIAPQIVALTRPALAERLDRLVAAADPDALAERVRTDRAARRVTFRPAGPGMGTMTLLTGAEDIEAVRTALNALTMAARQGQDDLPTTAHAHDAERPWTGPCDPDGRHPSATRADTLVEAVTRAAEHPDHFADDEATQTPSQAADQRGHTRADVVVLVPLSVLTGASDAPALLEGYGPIPAQMAREAAATGTWRCAVVEDRSREQGGGSATHGTLLGLGRSTYTPSYVPGPRAREFIHLRDGHCRFPGCRRRADLCDLDHRTPWQGDGGGGPTCDCELQSLCRFHHRLKHQDGFTVRATGDGLEWTTPDGRRYHSTPRPLLVDVPKPPPPEPTPPF